MGALRDMPHAMGCKTVDIGGGLTGYLCVSGCQAMAAHLVQPGQTTGEVDEQPELTADQARRLVDAVDAELKDP